jgi:hypothetical protein
MASSWIERRATAGGRPRYLVRYTLSGRGARKRYGGIFKTMREATIRRQWIDGELAALRPPDLTLFVEPVPAPTFADAATRWQASRVDVAAATHVQHCTALNRALPSIGTTRLDALTAQAVADLVARLHADGKARESIRKTVTAIAMVLDHAAIAPNPARDRVTVKLPREEPEEPNPPIADHLLAVYRLLPSKHRLRSCSSTGRGRECPRST